MPAVRTNRRAKLVAIEFGKWAQLEGIGRPTLHGAATYNMLDRVDALFSWAIRALPIPYYVKARSHRLYAALQAEVAKRAPFATSTMDKAYFLAEAYNPASHAVNFRLSIRQNSQTAGFLSVLAFEPGYTTVLIPSAEIFNDTGELPSVLVKATPIDVDHQIAMVFGHLGFVELPNPALLPHATVPALRPQSEKQAGAPAKKVKCVVWDLDNTLWDGVLIEDGLSGIKLRPWVVEVIKALDRRGIVNSIASKNYVEDAEQALQSFGLEEFVFPQFDWGPKSQSVRAIQQTMNIGLDTMVLVDDQPFERAEVTSSLPEVETFDIDAIGGLLDHPRFDVPLTEESALRRKRYQEQVTRDAAKAPYSDYVAFIRSCEISVELASLDQDRLPRAHELAQRTNQMNFSGNRYTIKELESLSADERYDCWTIAAEDRFGSYGVLGLAVVDHEQSQVIDLMMSCRIQKKMVDHAVLCDFLQRYHSPDKPLTIRYRPTPRNRQAAGLFKDLGFEEMRLDESTILFSFPAESPMPTNDVVSIRQR